MEIKQIDIQGLNFIAKEEGLRLAPYLDSRGIPTIGIGNTYYADGRRVKMTDPPLTMAQAADLFRSVVKHYEITVWSVTRDDITQNQFNALVSICYNIGIAGFKGSTLLKRVNANPQDERIKAAFEMWRNAGSKKGILLSRRRREWALYFS